MSDYPPVPPYGASYGSQPQTNTPYLPPTYPNQYMQTQQDNGRSAQAHMASNYDTSLSAYGYNNSLPGFNAGSLASVPPPPPIYQGWNQDAASLPSYPTPHNNMQYADYGGNSYQSQATYPPPQPQTYHQSAQQAAPYDEGELSEGEFDTYGGQYTGGTAAVGHGSHYYQGNDGTGYMNTANHAVYPSSQGYSNHANAYTGGNNYANANRNSNYSQEPHQVGRQQSDSYSPYVGTNSRVQDYQQSSWTQSNNKPEASYSIRNGTGPTKDKSVEHAPVIAQPARAMKTIEPNDPDNASLQGGKPQGGKPEGRKPDRVQSNAVAQIAEGREAVPSHPTTQQPPAIQSGVSKSVGQARKAAERAILNLWPYEVRFPNYVEEGLDENIVGGLFDSLGFARTPSKAAVVNSDAKSTSDQPNSPSAKETGSAEARVSIVAHNGKLVNSSTAPNSMSPSTTSANAVPAKAELTEKEKNLKLKMEALRKSREERAQKVAARTNAQPPVAPAPPPEPPIVPTVTHSPTTSPLASIQETTILLTTSSPSTAATVLPAKPTSPRPTSPPQPTSLPQPAPPQPVIPGLFLASSSSPALSTLGVSLNNQRKRPVAADFDTSISTMSYKRPFGLSRNESFVIDVSDEEPDSEDEDVAMDLDSQADQASPIQAARKVSDRKTAALQNLPPLTNFPARKAFTSPTGSSAASTPLVQAVSKAARRDPQVLQQKETEIELLKKRIAEAEAANAAKRRAQQTSSGAPTPQLQPVNGNGDIASKVEASMQMQQLIGVTEDKVSSEQKKLAETRVAELEKAAEVKRHEAESRRLRREKIATDLPRVDAEVEQSQLKLQQLREEMAKIEAIVQKSLDDKRRLAEEMERLSQEAEEQLQAQKDKLKDLTRGETANSPHQEISTTEAELEEVAAQPGPTIQNALPVSPVREENALPAAHSLPPRPNELELAESSDDLTSDQALEATLQEQVRAEAESHDQSGEDMDIEEDTDIEEDMDIDVEDDSYAPDPAQLAPEMSPKEFGEDNSATAVPPVHAAEAIKFPIVEAESAISEPGVDHVQPTSAIEEDDDYEPPEATPPVDIPSPEVSPPFSPALPEPIISEPITELEQLSHGRREAEETDTGDVKVNGSGPRLAEGDREISNQTQSFTPYESPLKCFRAFRFHTEYQHEVPGGLKSVTYSHKIDPDTEFCRYELAGGVCNDKSCEFQHFRDIALPEDSIISALGSPEEFPADQQEKFREGLKLVLADLRTRKIRDFNRIAAEVIGHRSKFLGDASKVLMLEGTTI